MSTSRISDGVAISSRKVVLAIAGFSVMVVTVALLWNKVLPYTGSGNVDISGTQPPLPDGVVAKFSKTTNTPVSFVDNDPKGVRRTSKKSVLENTVALEPEGAGGDSSPGSAFGANPFDTTQSANLIVVEAEYQSGFSGNPTVNAQNPFNSNAAASSSLTDNLLEVALTEPQSASVSQAAIDFSLTPAPGIHLLPQPTRLAPSTVVYAHIVTDGPCSSCILKWEHLDSETIQFLSVESLSPANVATFFVTPWEGWQAGTYRLSVYESAESPLLLGQGGVIISGVDVNQLTMVPPVEFIQSLIDNGLAIPKGVE